MQRAMVLAAGAGTRLRPLTDVLPKPLLPFGDRPLIEHALAALERAGLGAGAVVNVHAMPEKFEAWSRTYGGNLELLPEARIRGTAGGIAGARARFQPGPVVVVNADLVLEEIPSSLAERARDEHLVLVVAPRAAGEGRVGLDRDGAVVRLRGERFGEEATGADYLGLCALGQRGLDALPDEGCLIGDFALPLLRRGGRVPALAVGGEYLLPGDGVEDYWRAQLTWLARARSGESFVASSAEIIGEVEIVDCVIGRDARVVGSGKLERVVVWPAAIARAPLAGAIVASENLVLKIQ